MNQIRKLLSEQQIKILQEILNTRLKKIEFKDWKTTNCTCV